MCVRVRPLSLVGLLLGGAHVQVHDLHDEVARTVEVETHLPSCCNMEPLNHNSEMIDEVAQLESLELYN